MSLYNFPPGAVQGLETERAFESQRNLHVVSAARRHLFQQPKPLLRERCRRRAVNRPKRDRLALLYADCSFLNQGRDQLALPMRIRHMLNYPTMEGSTLMTQY